MSHFSLNKRRRLTNAENIARKRDINKKFWEEIIAYFPMI
jgi:DNA-binding IscR family transcriptional regulator